MKSSQLRAGVIGTGFIGPVHVEALRRSGVEVVALADNTLERAQAKADEFHVPKAYGSVEDLLADPDIDVVHITSPNHLHFPHAKAALLAGKHVVCEKPMAMNSQESGELVRLAQEKGLVNVVNFNLRYYPLSQHAHSLVTSGELGQVYSVQGSYLQDWLLLPTDWNWRLEPGLGGDMRAVADVGSHWIDLVSFITGLEVESVMSDFKTFLPVRKKPKQTVETFTGKMQSGAPIEYEDQEITTEDYASVLFRYKGGARGVMTVSQVSAGRKNQLFYEIDAAQSAISWNGEEPNQMWIGHRDRPNELLMKDPSLLSPEARRFAFYPGGHAEGFPDTFKSLYHAVYSYIQKGDFSIEPDFPTFKEGHKELLVGEAILRSSREDRWVSISEVTEASEAQR